MFRQHKLGIPATGDRRPASRRIRFQRSTQQIGTPVKRRTSDRRVAVSDSNVQHNRLVHCQSGVPATGDRRPASRRIRFQRSTQQISTPSNWRTDVSAPNVTTQQISTPVNRRTGDRRLLNWSEPPRSPTKCRNWRRPSTRDPNVPIEIQNWTKREQQFRPAFIGRKSPVIGL